MHEYMVCIKDHLTVLNFAKIMANFNEYNEFWKTL